MSSERKAIKELPRVLSEKIAAGEVVTRPASVVKELMENSLDAGASSLTVEIKNGGKSYIRVTDDGCGIPCEEAETAFKRHATSKISTLEDMDNISTLGFRGEALNSIAAVSRLELVTKTRDEKTGTKLYMEGGEALEKKAVGTADGSTVIVSDLFYNTPARLKFMKVDRTEASMIIEIVSNMAMAYPDVRIRLINNDNILYSTPGRGDLLANILTIYGKDIATELLPVKAESTDFGLTGYISPPAKTKSSRRFQIFFINGRSVSSKVMERALMTGYRETIFEGRYPVAFLFLSVQPARLDVNIHPAKSEVRFDDEKLLEEFVAEAVRSTILSKSAVAGITGRKEYAVSGTQQALTSVSMSSDKDKSTLGTAQSEPKNDHNGFRSAGVYPHMPPEKTAENGEFSDKQAEQGSMLFDGSKESEHGVGLAEMNASQRSTDAHLMEEQISLKFEGNDADSDIADITKLLSAKRLDMTNMDKEELMTDEVETLAKPFDITEISPITTIFSTYIIGMDSDSFYFIDQHAAHERVLYEQFMKQYREDEKMTQQLLVPLVVEAPFSVTNDTKDRLEIINGLGYEVEEFGPKSFNIRGIPAFLSISEAECFLIDIMEALPEGGLVGNVKALERVISRACKSAVKGGDRLDTTEIRRLLTDLNKCENPFSCPHGRPVFVRLRKRDIERLFKRI